ncbi:Vmc-like lipoprotein signal peptide domain-containing protein [Ureaplasma zalophigenitalium]|uniref:Uncharacterized protein n=1 Tax=Ureaplasma zalophigenitalium TaxID=907723 RepID=A0ABT3BQ02_9BACT|nr:hypothetical protein [Ureaplasma zalophigenitalium]MCV3754343.1 hypothetical protein [Ureaplasma zalophigenitalium]
MKKSKINKKLLLSSLGLVVGSAVIASVAASCHDPAKDKKPKTDPVKPEPGKEPAPSEPGKEPAPSEPGKEPAPSEPGKEPAPSEPGKEPADQN